jgi:hypothetical protein
MQPLFSSAKIKRVVAAYAIAKSAARLGRWTHSVRWGFTFPSPSVHSGKGKALLAEKMLSWYSPSDPVLNNSFEGGSRILLPVAATVH